MKRHFPLHIHISTLFLLLLVLVGGLIGGVGYKLSRDMLESAAVDLTTRIGRETLNELKQTVAPAEMAAKLLAHSAIPEGKSLNERLQGLSLVTEALNSSSALSSLYVGYDSGDFFFVRRIRSDAEAQTFAAPEGTRYIVQSIERGSGNAAAAKGRYLFLDQTLKTLREDERPEYAASYDPRTRGWYKEAAVASSAITTPPYLFFSNRKVGTTIAARAHNQLGVVGADILLETLSESLVRQKVTPGSHVVLVNPQGYVIAHEDVAKLVTVANTPDAKPSLTRIDELSVPVLTGLVAQIKAMPGDKSLETQIKLADDDWRVTIHPVRLEGAQPLYLINAIPDREMFSAAIKLRSTSVYLMLFVFLLAMPLAWLIARSISGPLRSLVIEAESIRHFDFSRTIEVKSLVLEVNELGATMDSMKRTIQRFLDVSEAVAAEENFDRLLPMLLRETLTAGDAEAGVLYLVDKDGMIPVAANRINGDELISTMLPMSLTDAGPLMDAAIRDGVPSSGELSQADIECIDLAELIETTGCSHAIVMPLLNRSQHLIGVALLLRKSATEESQVSFVKALSGSAASALETRELIKAQKELFEAFIKLIAGAIDAKSPYTGGHCARVPELTKMLARAACAETTGPYAGFQLDESEWEAIHVGSWLHDCGKVTTPEYVVDKATKLETIYDRIHEVRMRFEVLKRDAEIACLKAIVGGEAEATAQTRLAAELQQLDDDYAFVATCNEGGEFMAPEKVERLKTLANRTWLRTLDDRIGVSHEEKERKARVPAVSIPAVETLLADKPEHIFERRAQDVIAEDNPWGFRMPVPKMLYNKGELYNLSVARGTLSEEERFKINEHIVQTLIMLSALPFPKHLRQVPEIASGHHEKMDGTGYPRRLTKDEMSPVARMMAIADIFEALTAVDRPYKKGKTLSEAIKIMSFMKKDQHIDAELFELFLRSGAYQEYAERFMKPEQIDEVNVAAYLSPAQT